MRLRKDEETAPPPVATFPQFALFSPVSPSSSGGLGEMGDGCDYSMLKKAASLQSPSFRRGCKYPVLQTVFG
jgi:hypothetical protein